MQELGRLQMKSQLEGAGLGLPLQGGAQGHNPGNRQPKREDALCEGAGETHTAHSGTEREGRRQAPAEASHVAGSFEDRGSVLLGDLSWHLPRGPAQVVLRHGQEQEAGPGAPRGPERWGRAD